MADNRRREIRNKRRDKQRLRDMAKKNQVADDWEDYANRELLDIGQDYDYSEYDEDEVFPRDYQ